MKSVRIRHKTDCNVCAKKVNVYTEKVSFVKKNNKKKGLHRALWGDIGSSLCQIREHHSK